MAEPKSQWQPSAGGLDIRDERGGIVLCACHLSQALHNLRRGLGIEVLDEDSLHEGWEPGEEVDNDALVEEVVVAALYLKDQIQNQKRNR